MSLNPKAALVRCAIFACFAPATTAAQEPLVETERFVLYSRFEFNLFDRLRRWASTDDRDGEACVAALSPTDQRGWRDAVERFEAFGGRDGRRAALRARFAMVDPDLDADAELGPVPSWFGESMRAAFPAYRSCWWPDDDRRNREWIEAVAPLLRRAEGEVARRIAAVHGVEWSPGKIPIDVVPDVNFGGGNTVVDPHHILLNSVRPGYQGFGGLEMVFHEASHTIVSPRSRGSIDALRRAAEAEGVELPRELWHAVLFFTAGAVTRDVVRELWGEPYEPYMYSQGLFERAWPEWRAPLEASWLPYVRGAISLESAAGSLVRAVGAR